MEQYVTRTQLMQEEAAWNAFYSNAIHFGIFTSVIYIAVVFIAANVVYVRTKQYPRQQNWIDIILWPLIVVFTLLYWLIAAFEYTFKGIKNTAKFVFFLPAKLINGTIDFFDFRKTKYCNRCGNDLAENKPI